MTQFEKLDSMTLFEIWEYFGKLADKESDKWKALETYVTK